MSALELRVARRRQRGAVGDAMLGAGATILLLYSTAQAIGGWGAIVAGVSLILGGAVMLWGTPRPELRTRMLASVAGLLVGFGLATIDGAGAWVALAAGALLLAGVLWTLRAR